MVRTTLLLCTAFSISFFSCTNLSLAVDTDNLQDTCPAATPLPQTIFINGFPCKNPANITASDFKSSNLNRAGKTDNIAGSSTAISTAADFPGLNTLGLAVARTDIEKDGLVMPHSHPRASEMFYLRKGVVIAGFVDTKSQLFMKVLREGDVFVFPRGLVHYCLNSGSESAVAFSVLNSQNPGLVSVSDNVSGDSEAIDVLKRRLLSLSELEKERVEDVNLFGL